MHLFESTKELIQGGNHEWGNRDQLMYLDNMISDWGKLT